MCCSPLKDLIKSILTAINCVFNVSRLFYWSDSSEISLYWIKGVNKEWKAWVENRVNAVRCDSSVNDWNYVPGNLNPADIPTREGNICEIMSN